MTALLSLWLISPFAIALIMWSDIPYQNRPNA